MDEVLAVYVFYSGDLQQEKLPSVHSTYMDHLKTQKKKSLNTTYMPIKVKLALKTVSNEKISKQHGT